MTSTGAAGSVRELRVGDEVEAEIGAVAHGGSCVARVDGRVVFVRYALPGERALVRITEAKRGSFCRGEAVAVLRADPRRVTPPCSHFRPGGCGGCDFQHAAPDLQRELKAAVIAEQFQRLAGLTVSVAVEPLPGGDFEWRGRVRWGLSRDDDGRPRVGPRHFHGNGLVPITAAEPCLIADPDFSDLADRLRPPARADEVVMARRGGGPPAVVFLGGGRPAPAAQTEEVGGRAFRVETAGFWQAHRDAAETFSRVVAEILDGFAGLRGGTAWDLYGGAGLFAAVLAEAVGETGRVISVESDRPASRHAAANLSDLSCVEVTCARVDRFLDTADDAVDAVLLDPPRSGAGAAVCRGIAERRPSVVVYVACDPAALARDAATLTAAGYAMTSLRAFDAFPQTHHVECVAVFTPAAPPAR